MELKPEPAVDPKTESERITAFIALGKWRRPPGLAARRATVGWG